MGDLINRIHRMIAGRPRQPPHHLRSRGTLFTIGTLIQPDPFPVEGGWNNKLILVLVLVIKVTHSEKHASNQRQ